MKRKPFLWLGTALLVALPGYASAGDAVHLEEPRAVLLTNGRAEAFFTINNHTGSFVGLKAFSSANAAQTELVEPDGESISPPVIPPGAELTMWPSGVRLHLTGLTLAEGSASIPITVVLDGGSEITLDVPLVGVPERPPHHEYVHTDP